MPDDTFYYWILANIIYFLLFTHCKVIYSSRASKKKKFLLQLYIQIKTRTNVVTESIFKYDAIVAYQLNRAKTYYLKHHHFQRIHLFFFLVS